MNIRRFVFATLLCSLPVTSFADDTANVPVTADTAPAKAAESAAAGVMQDESVGLFDAMKDGRVNVRFVALDSTKGTAVLENKTGKPLQIRLPAAVGAIHVVSAQMGMGGGMGGDMGGMGGMGGGGGGGQAMGGGMGGMGGGMGGGGMGGGGMGGGGMGGGMFNLSPDKPAKIPTSLVCLEYGKKDPNPKMTYQLVPIEQVSNDPKVANLCSALGRGDVNQKVAQAAAWHLANDLSWQKLRFLPKVVSKYTGVEYHFTAYEIEAARRAVNFLTVNSEQYVYESAAE